MYIIIMVKSLRSTRAKPTAVKDTKVFCEIAKIVHLLMAKTGMNLETYEAELPGCVQVRNKQLFPFLKA